MQTMQSNLFYCKITLHVSGVAAPIIRSTKSITAASATGHNIGPATSFQRGQIWSRWTEVAVPMLRPVTEAAVTVFSTPADRCGRHPKHLEWFCSKINTCILLHLVWFLLTMIPWVVVTSKDLFCCAPFFARMLAEYRKNSSWVCVLFNLLSFVNFNTFDYLISWTNICRHQLNILQTLNG